MDLDVGAKTLQSQGLAKDSEACENRTVPRTELIPRALLKKYLHSQQIAKIELIAQLERELRELEQFEKTFCSLSEPLQDALAPFYFRRM